MKKFIILYHAPTTATEQMKNVSPEDMQKGMEPWMAWVSRVGNSMVDLGTPLGNGTKVTKSGTLPSTKQVVGYSILQANSKEEAVALLKDHPHLGWEASCEIEIHESLPLPGM